MFAIVEHAFLIKEIMLKFKVTNKLTSFTVFHTVNVNNEFLARKILRAFFNDNYTIEKV